MGDVVSSKLFIDFKKMNTEGTRRGVSTMYSMRHDAGALVDAMHKKGIGAVACEVYSAKVVESGLEADVWSYYTRDVRAFPRPSLD
jgi:hypothetical protein